MNLLSFVLCEFLQIFMCAHLIGSIKCFHPFYKINTLIDKYQLIAMCMQVGFREILVTPLYIHSRRGWELNGGALCSLQTIVLLKHYMN